MPKLKHTVEQEQNLKIQAVIVQYMTLREMKRRNDIASRIPMKEDTFNKKFRDPSKKFSVGELRRVYTVLNVPLEERVGLN